MAEYSRTRQFVRGCAIFRDDYRQTFMARGYWFSYSEQDDYRQPCSPTVLGCAFAVVIGFLQIKYQDQHPFQTHPMTIYVAIASFMMYCLLYVITQKFSSHSLYRAHAHLIAPATLFSALLSLLSATSMLFPESVKWVFYALCILLSSAELVYSLFNKIKNKLQVNWHNSNITREHTLRPPV